MNKTRRFAQVEGNIFAKDLFVNATYFITGVGSLIQAGDRVDVVIAYALTGPLAYWLWRPAAGREAS